MILYSLLSFWLHCYAKSFFGKLYMNPFSTRDAFWRHLQKVQTQITGSLMEPSDMGLHFLY